MGFLNLIDRLEGRLSGSPFSPRAVEYGNRLIAEKNDFVMKCFEIISKNAAERIKGEVTREYTEQYKKNRIPTVTVKALQVSFAMSDNRLIIHTGSDIYLRDSGFNDIPQTEEYKKYGILHALVELVCADIKALNFPEVGTVTVKVNKDNERYSDKESIRCTLIIPVTVTEYRTSSI